VNVNEGELDEGVLLLCCPRLPPSPTTNKHRLLKRLFFLCLHDIELKIKRVTSSYN
jgi:hypothetical protein